MDHSTLTTWLLAEIDTERRQAVAAGHGDSRVITDFNADWVQVDLPQNSRPVYDVRFIAHWSPKRVIEMCDINRRLVEHEDSNYGMSTTIKILALRYAHRLGYQADWHPDATPQS
jgi:hypothetical protein